jgi:hypothetical protein
MRISHILTAAVVVGSIGVIAGCSGSGSSSMSSVVPTSHVVRQAMSHDMTGVAPKYLESLHFGAGAPAVRPNSGGKLLAVSDFGTGAVEVLNASYALTQTITNGMNGPDGNWYDQAHNLYVANYAGINVQEYAPGGTSPSFTYSTGLTDPIDVTTDESGNVYVVDYQGGFVNEYAQNSNTVINTCATGGAPEGIAVGEHGKVFVSENFSAGGAGIIEYASGLAGCSSTTRISSLSFAGGLQLDDHNNLVACDQLVGVDIIPKPNYNTISSTITGTSDAFHVALDRYNTVVFIADPGLADVAVDSYPSGSPVTVLNGANGLSDPAGVATKPYQH